MIFFNRSEDTKLIHLFQERADRIRRRAAAGSSNGTGAVDGSEHSDNSNESFTLNDESTNPMDTTDIHQKGS